LHPASAGGWAAPHRGSRHARGYGTAWDKLREQIMARDCGLCQTCHRAGRVTLAREVDHIVPKFEGGTDGMHNLAAICQACHKAKTATESARSK
jgi:5-methylcytosine-specific restriction enzyme A